MSKQAIGRPPLFSNEQIIETGLIVEKRDGYATSVSIYNELGGRGNPKRIKSLWDSFQQTRTSPKKEKEAIRKEKIPSELQLMLDKLLIHNNNALNQLANHIWIEATQILEGRLAKSLEEHAQGLLRAKKIETEAERAINISDALVEDLKSTLEEEKAKYIELKLKNASLEIEIQHLKKMAIFYPGQ